MQFTRFLFDGGKALKELGLEQSGLFALYKIGLRTGYYRCLTRKKSSSAAMSFRRVLMLPNKDELIAVLGKKGKETLLAEADEIVDGRVRLFGSIPAEMDLAIPGPLHHWTYYEVKGMGTQFNMRDVKFLWEAARFGWSYILGRAYHLTNDERYSAAFWIYAENFLDANPPYFGPNWISGQEAAIRLLSYIFALHIFCDSVHTNKSRMSLLLQAISDHAARIPPTMVYARAQNNNHLLTEAAGLFTAGVVLPDHPSAKQWRNYGWKWFHRGLQSQIEIDGTYTQHSTNYHRLMLQVALWMVCLNKTQGYGFPESSRERISASTTWLYDLLDTQSGCVPNLGPNDGAYIFPLTLCPHSDYRPVLQAASEIFKEERLFDHGPWDEMTLWLKTQDSKVTPHPQITSKEVSITRRAIHQIKIQNSPNIIRLPEHDSWAYFRVVKFNSRPGHADQLHVDLWWRGLNLAQDAGTYLYNAPPPWDNSLSSSQVHNTVTIDQLDQMRRVGRFLYLDWAQAEILRKETHEQDGFLGVQRLVAQHDGYRSLGIIHQRSVEAFREGKWLIRDSLLPAQFSRSNRSPQTGAGGFESQDYQHQKNSQPRKHSVCVQWLLPDWSFEVNDQAIDKHINVRILSPFGWITLNFELGPSCSFKDGRLELQVVRSGEVVFGSGTASPILGWISPTYGEKIPALSLRLTTSGRFPISITSEWLLPT